MTELNKREAGLTERSNSVATILERELEPAIKEWLRRVNLIPAFTQVPLDDHDRAVHLPRLFRDLTCRLRLAANPHVPISDAPSAHGQTRRGQGYSPAMLVAESRVFEVVTFRTLHLHLGELDQDQLLLDVMLIADEVDRQLTEAVRCWGNTINRVNP